ncbi:MAG: ROK family protein [Planctomycetes bacterium]|nr:ROK family protein [Planctomycetota bacterium]
MKLVGIDLGGTGIKAGACDETGRILDSKSIPTGLGDGPEAVLDRMAQLARDLGADKRVGVGSPGLIDHANGRVLESPNLLTMQGVPMRREIARRLGFAERDVILENDANCAAFGEQWCGAGKGESDMLLVTLGTGVGGGLVLAGKLYGGPGGMAGEIGHVCIDPDGPPCGCGRRGCVEQFASATAAIRRAKDKGLPRAKPGDLVQLSRLAREADGPERALLHDIGRDLGRGLGMVVCLLDLRTYVIGGGFGAATDVLEAGIRVGLRDRSYGDRLQSVRILPAQLGSDAGWIGAARLALS